MLSPPRIVCILSVLTSGLGCGSSTGTTSGSDNPGAGDTSSTEARFQRLAETYVRAHLDAVPQDGVDLGLHEYDGKLPDISPGSSTVCAGSTTPSCHLAVLPSR